MLAAPQLDNNGNGARAYCVPDLLDEISSVFLPVGAREVAFVDAAWRCRFVGSTSARRVRLSLFSERSYPVGNGAIRLNRDDREKHDYHNDKAKPTKLIGPNPTRHCDSEQTPGDGADAKASYNLSRHLGHTLFYSQKARKIQDHIC